MSKRPSRARVVFDWVLGITLLSIGVVSGFLPGLQGWLFILMGLAILSSHSRWARAIYERVKGVGRNLRDRVKQRRARAGGGQDSPGDDVTGSDQ